jgi:hypothetical protein
VAEKVSEAVGLDFRFPLFPASILTPTIRVQLPMHGIPASQATIVRFGEDALNHKLQISAPSAQAVQASKSKKPRMEEEKASEKGTNDTGESNRGDADDFGSDSEDDGGGVGSSCSGPPLPGSRPSIDVTVPSSNAVIALGTTDEGVDYRVQFAAGCVEAVSAGEIVAARFAAAQDLHTPSATLGAPIDLAPASRQTLKRLHVWYGASLEVEVFLDMSPSGYTFASSSRTPAPTLPSAASESTVSSSSSSSSSSSAVAPSSASGIVTFTNPLHSCIVTAAICRSSYLFAGRYNKFNRNLSQTPWYLEGSRQQPSDSGLAGATSIVDAHRRQPPKTPLAAATSSVEELLGAPIANALAKFGG